MSGLTKSFYKNMFQCQHNNRGYCRYGERCHYQHYTEECQNRFCRTKECPFRHPKICKNQQNCKFYKLHCCAYRHDEENKSEQINKEKDKIKKLEAEIYSLKIKINEKEEELKILINHEKELEEKINALKLYKQDEINRINDKVDQLIQENEFIKEENNRLKAEKARFLIQINNKDSDEMKDLSEKINLQESVIQKFKSMLKCDKCDFQAESLTEFNFHQSVKHPVKATKGHLKCTTCDFKAKKQLDLELHESIKHPKNNFKNHETFPPARVALIAPVTDTVPV